MLNDMVVNKVASIRNSERNNKICVNFIIENVVFASNLSNNNIILNKIRSQNLNENEAKCLQRKIFFSNESIYTIGNKIKKIQNFKGIDIRLLSREHKKNFPANILKILFKRKSNELLKYKSKASINRHIVLFNEKRLKSKNLMKSNHENVYQALKLSFLFFPNGKIHSTGCQLRDDILIMLTLYQIIFSVMLG
jgi:hypothetical protein